MWMEDRSDPKLKNGCRYRTKSFGFFSGARCRRPRCSKGYSLYTIDNNGLGGLWWSEYCQKRFWNNPKDNFQVQISMWLKAVSKSPKIYLIMLVRYVLSPTSTDERYHKMN